jgi:hypothetical protein
MTDDYADHLIAIESDDAFVAECFDQIDAANQFSYYSPADERARLCYQEAERRGRVDLYQRGFDAAYATAQADRHLGTARNALLGAHR